uniref:NADH-ubiquinone oxidoreductase chain 6 n=1 Tax=Curculionidae sp. 3 AH-2016 TaxID=1903829 RepID=A0A343C2Q3_9CUCU|nr:NADH dehydrogenase subunit 6 [Curculionidae sp. 3 AH-2016]
MLFFSWMFSMFFMIMNHPMSLGGILVIQTILMALTTGFLFMNFWFSYIIFLVMIGGLLVMFIYMTSIASNEKFEFPKNFIYMIMLSFFIMAIMFKFKDNFYTFQFYNLSMLKMFSFPIKNFNLNKYFNYPGMFVLTLLMIYLLITLIAIVKITGKNYGSLRQK